MRDFHRFAPIVMLLDTLPQTTTCKSALAFQGQEEQCLGVDASCIIQKEKKGKEFDVSCINVG